MLDSSSIFTIVSWYLGNFQRWPVSFYPGDNILLVLLVYILWSHYSFWYSDCLPLASGSSNLAPVPFRQVPSSPFSGFILYISGPRLRIINFLRNFGSFMFYLYVAVLSSLLSISGGRAVGLSTKRSASLCSCEGLLSLLWPFPLFHI